MSLIIVGQRDTGVLDTKLPCQPSAGAGKTPYHLDSHLILKSESKLKSKLAVELEPRYGIEP